MKAVVSLSGGMDSAFVLKRALIQFSTVHAVAFKYPSGHNHLELDAARAIAKHEGIDLQIVDLSSLFKGIESMLFSGADLESAEATVVPNRNAIFISVLVSIAWSKWRTDPSFVLVGIQQGEGRSAYPDCRPAFCGFIRDAMWEATNQFVKVVFPILYFSKAQIVREGIRIDVPFALTRTCYSSNLLACGKCGACKKRLAGFANAGVSDPIDYFIEG